MQSRTVEYFENQLIQFLKLYIQAPDDSLTSTDIAPQNALEIFKLIQETPFIKRHSDFIKVSDQRSKSILEQIEKVKSKVANLNQSYIRLYDNEQRLNSLKISNAHILKKKQELEQDNSELQDVLGEYEEQLSGLKLSVKKLLQSNCHLETKLSIIQDEISQYEEVKDELDLKSKNIYQEEAMLKRQLQKLKNEVNVIRTEYFKMSKEVEALKLKKEALVAKIGIHQIEFEVQNQEFIKEEAALNQKIKGIEELVKGNNENKICQEDTIRELKEQLIEKIDEVNIIEVNSLKQNRQKDNYQEAILEIENKLNELESGGNVEEIKTIFNDKVLDYLYKLNFKQIFDKREDKDSNKRVSKNRNGTDIMNFYPSSGDNLSNGPLEIETNKNNDDSARVANSQTHKTVCSAQFNLSENSEIMKNLVIKIDNLHTKINQLLQVGKSTNQRNIESAQTTGDRSSDDISISPIRFKSTSQVNPYNQLNNLESTIQKAIQSEMQKIKDNFFNKD